MYTKVMLRSEGHVLIQSISEAILKTTRIRV
jgi:hypothetical protein